MNKYLQNFNNRFVPKSSFPNCLQKFLPSLRSNLVLSLFLSIFVSLVPGTGEGLGTVLVQNTLGPFSFLAHLALMLSLPSCRLPRKVTQDA
jgi:hypothetical protein